MFESQLRIGQIWRSRDSLKFTVEIVDMDGVMDSVRWKYRLVDPGNLNHCHFGMIYSNSEYYIHSNYDLLLTSAIQ